MRLLFIGLVSLLGGACASGKQPALVAPTASAATLDVALICDEAKLASSRDHFAASVEAKLASTEGRNIFNAAAQSSDDQKHAVIKAGAAEVGVTNWDCMAPLEKLYGPQRAAQ